MPCYIRNKYCISPIGSFNTERDLPLDDNELHVVEPDYKSIISNAGLRRRMGRMLRMGVASGLECAKGHDDIDAIITATGLGCIADTEKFLDSFVRNDETLLNPTAFIQSTFNTIGAHIGLILGNRCYNMTYTHRGFSFETALDDAIMKLADGEARSVLLGAVDESTSLVGDVMRRLRLLRNGLKHGECSSFFLLSNEKKDATVEIADSNMVLLPEENVFDRVYSFLAENSLEIKDIDFVLDGTALHVEEKFNCTCLKYKELCGENPVASSFGVWLASEIINNGAVPLSQSEIREDFCNVLVLTGYGGVNFSMILLRKC